MKTEEIPNQASGFASDLAGLPSFFIDPESAAKRVHSKWFWIVPLLIACIIGVAVGVYLMPMMLHVAANAPIPEGATAEQRDRGAAFAGTAIKFGVYLSPIITVIIWAIQAAILLGIATVTGVTARFGALFNLVAGCAMIQTLAAVATAVILHFKGEASTAAELKPAMGLDIFMPEGMNKFLVAFGGYFSVFQIWWIVMLALVFAAAFRVSKAKGFAVVFPLWLLGLVLTLVGAVFQR